MDPEAPPRPLDAGDPDEDAWSGWTKFTAPLDGGVQAGMESRIVDGSAPALRADPSGPIRRARVGDRW